MKKLLVFLFVMSVFAGCSEDKDREPDLMTDGTVYYQLFERYYHVDNIKDFNENSIYGVVGKDTTWVLGVKNQKRWVGMFDESSKTLLQEWKGTEIVTEAKKLYFEPRDFKNTDIGEILIMVSENLEPSNTFFYLTNTLQLNEIRISEQYALDRKFIIIDKDKILGTYVLNNNTFRGIFSLEGEVLVNSICERRLEDQEPVFLSGFKGDKVWFAKCDKNYLIQEEWTGVEKFNRNIKIHLGYGEYDEFYIDALNMKEQPLKMDWGYAIVPQYLKQGEGKRISDIFLLNNKNVFYYSSMLGETPLLRSWYKKSILVNDKIVLSPEGEVLAEFTISYSDMEPVSYTNGMRVSIYGTSGSIECINLMENKIIWKTNIIPPFEIQSNAQITTIILNKEKQLWDYQCNVLNFDGSKQHFNFSVNIETGELTYK